MRSTFVFLRLSFYQTTFIFICLPITDLAIIFDMIYSFSQHHQDKFDNLFRIALLLIN
jgi:hypothetical protein